MGLILGEHTYGSPILRGEMNHVEFGKFCQIGINCVVDSGFTHNTENISTYPFHAWMEPNRWPNNNICKGNVIVGNDVWVGEDVLIMSGVRIYDGAVIGARSIITKNVKPYTKVVGKDRIIGHRFSEWETNTLQAISWWDWSIPHIENVVPLLHSNNVRGLLKYFKDNIQ